MGIFWQRHKGKAERGSTEDTDMTQKNGTYRQEAGTPLAC